MQRDSATLPANIRGVCYIHDRVSGVVTAGTGHAFSSNQNVLQMHKEGSGVLRNTNGQGNLRIGLGSDRIGYGILSY